MENFVSSVLGAGALDLREVPHINSCTLTVRPALQNLACTCSFALARLYMMHFCNSSGWSPSHVFLLQRELSHGRGPATSFRWFLEGLHPELGCRVRSAAGCGSDGQGCEVRVGTGESPRPTLFPLRTPTAQSGPGL